MKPWTIADIQSRLNTLDQVDSDDPREKTRQRIMDVASEHFVRFGFRRARIGDIARDSVVGKGTPYLYFTSKKVLLFACLSREKRTLIPALQVVFSLPPEQQLEAYLRCTIRFVMTAPLSRALLRREGDMEAVLRDLLKEQPDGQAKSIATVSAFIAPLAPGLSEARRETLTRVLQAVSLSTGHIDLDLFSLSLDDLIDSLVPILTRGIIALEAE